MTAIIDQSETHRDGRLAPRYSIAAPVRFRVDGGGWCEGTTVNISRLGLLFRASAAQKTLEPPCSSGRLEVRIDLAPDQPTAGAVVLCWGRVVRCCQPIDGDSLVAVTIDRFEMLAKPDSDAVDEPPAGGTWRRPRETP